MKKEKILSDVQDLVLCLKGKKLENDIIESRWKKKRDIVISNINSISAEDKIWLDIEYDKWIAENGIK